MDSLCLLFHCVYKVNTTEFSRRCECKISTDECEWKSFRLLFPCFDSIWHKMYSSFTNPWNTWSCSAICHRIPSFFSYPSAHLSVFLSFLLSCIQYVIIWTCRESYHFWSENLFSNFHKHRDTLTNTCYDLREHNFRNVHQQPNKWQKRNLKP